MTGAVPRLLLLVDGPIVAENAGEVFLRSLFLHYPQGHACRLALMRSAPSTPPANWIGFPLTVEKRVWERRLTRFGQSASRAASTALSLYSRSVRTGEVVDHGTAFGRSHGVDRVMAVLNSPAVIYSASRIASALRVPLSTLVWDPPERLAAELLMDRYSTARLSDDFAHALEASTAVAVASQGMREAYAAEYGVDAKVMIQGIPAHWRRESSVQIPDRDSFVIGFAGSAYASAQFSALLGALSAARWEIAGRKVILRVLGRGTGLDYRGAVNIELLGWRDPADTVEQLRACDVCYVPYWMDHDHALAAELCFPNKISSYLAAAKPLFVHGPDRSSPARFAERYGLGVVCSSLDHHVILKDLERLLLDPNLVLTMAEASRRAIDDELSMDVFLDRFAWLVGTDRRLLRTPAPAAFDEMMCDA